MRRVNVSIFGESGVGKSTFVKHVRQGPHFDPAFTPRVTLQVEMETVTQYDVLAACETVEVVLLDFQGAGDSATHLLHIKSFARKANVVLFIYDVTRRETFEALRTIWAPHYAQVCRDNPVCMLIGNKLDEVEQGGHPRAVSEREVKTLGAAMNAAHCFEISAKCGKSADVKMPLDIALTEWLARPQAHSAEASALRLGEGKEGGGGCCS
jgi:GTPase SAR1 family protein